MQYYQAAVLAGFCLHTGIVRQTTEARIGRLLGDLEHASKPFKRCSMGALEPVERGGRKGFV